MYRNKCNIYGKNIRCHCTKFSFPENQEPASVHPWYKCSNTCHAIIVKFMAFSDHISRFKYIYIYIYILREDNLNNSTPLKFVEPNAKYIFLVLGMSQVQTFAQRPPIQAEELVSI
jgi:hypothetical protein